MSRDDHRFDWFSMEIRDANGQTLEQILKEGGPPPATGCGSIWDSGWRSHMVSLAAYRGQTVQLLFENRVTDPGAMKGYYNTWPYVDDVVVEA